MTRPSRCRSGPGKAWQAAREAPETPNRTLGLELQAFNASNEREIDDAFALLVERHGAALLVEKVNIVPPCTTDLRNVVG